MVIFIKLLTTIKDNKAKNKKKKEKPNKKTYNNFIVEQFKIVF